MSAQPHGFTENQGSNVYRGASLDEVLPRIKAELGPDAIILSEREGIVGGIGGFFAKKCVEVEAASRAVVDGGTGQALPRVPAHVATSAYTGEPVRRRSAAEQPERELTLADLLAQAPAATERELVFADLLAQAGPPAQGLPPVPEELVPEEFVPMVAPPAPIGRVDVIENEPVDYDFGLELETVEPVVEPIRVLDEEADVRGALRQAGFADAEADELVRHAMLHARPFAPHASPRDVVRAALAEALQTPLGWKAKRRVLVLAGTEGAGTSEVAAALCAGYARVGLTVAALGLDGVRAAVALATNTEDAAVSVGIAEDVDDVRRALPRLGRPDLLVAIAPTVVPGDEARRARTAELLAELPAYDLHLVLPSGATAADATAAHAALDGAVKVKGVLPVAMDDAAAIGGVISLALRERLELRWTASGSDDVRLATATPAELATRALP